MSWTRRLSLGRHRRWLALLLVLLAGQLCAAQGASALGPFTHLVLARQLAQPAWLEQPTLMTALYAGALAPDAGYYPGGQEELAQAAHLVNPWAVVRAMLDQAVSPEEQAFATGYLSHALLDRLGHESLVNRLSGLPFSGDPLTHKRVEWGLDCWLLSQPRHAWLWEVRAYSPAGLDLWRRALRQAYGVEVPHSILERSARAELAEIDRLPWIFWLSGQAKRPGRWSGNGLGWLMDYSLRPLAVFYMDWRDGYLNERAVLRVRPALVQDVADLSALCQQVAQRVGDYQPGAALPNDNLDADPACAGEACPEAQQARAWLRGLAKTR